MDLITQGILGAAVGQVGFQRTLGRKALAYGAIIGMMPDADVLVRFSSDMCAEMLHHRGFTHSLFFAPLIAPIMGYLCNYIHKQQLLPSWIGLWFWALITHPLLDVFTVYGTQLLAPFSNHRFSFCAVPIIDPAYSLPLLLSVIIGWFTKKRIGISQTIAAGTLLLTTAYLFLGIEVHDRALQAIKSQEATTAVRSEAFTTMFSIFYRRIVIEENDQFRIGFLNMLYPKPIKWHKFEKPKVDDATLAKREVQIFYWFADRWVLPTCSNGTVLLQDIRFGATDQNITGYWGIEVNDKKVTWQRFAINLSWENIKEFWHTIFWPS
jgi:inner membrane protein